MPSAPEVLVPPHQLKDLRLDAGPVRHELAIADTKHEIAAHDKRAVASAIPVEITVPRLAIKLQDQPVADQQINPPDSFDKELTSQPYSMAAERKPG